jgi:hypothetical protein
VIRRLAIAAALVAAVLPAAAPPEGLFAYVTDGREAVPPPPPNVFTPEVIHVSGGPHGPGDSIRVVGAVKSGAGEPRDLAGGRYRIVDGTGAVVEVPGSAGPGGRITAELALPVAGPVEIVFVPDPPALADGERLAAGISAPVRIALAPCLYRARVASPGSGEPVAAGDAVFKLEVG